MTAELQQAMARYEEARIRYRKAVLSSLDGTSNGDAIRQAIVACQEAGSELRKLRGTPPVQAAAAPAHRAAPASEAKAREQAIPGWAFVRRFLSTA